MRRLAARLFFLTASGWYALIPPLMPDGRVDLAAPLARWEQLRAFDTADACEKVAITYAQQLADQTDAIARARYRQVQYVRCVSAADPRLRGDSQ